MSNVSILTSAGNFSFLSRSTRRVIYGTSRKQNLKQFSYDVSPISTYLTQTRTDGRSFHPIHSSPQSTFSLFLLPHLTNQVTSAWLAMGSFRVTGPGEVRIHCLLFCWLTTQLLRSWLPFNRPSDDDNIKVKTSK